MRRFDVSRTTVRRALQDLQAAGMVIRRPGKGTYVSEPHLIHELNRLTGFVEDMQALNQPARAVVVKIETVTASAEVATHLACSVADAVVHIQRVRLASNSPVSFDDTWLPSDIGDRIATENLEVDPIFSLLEQKYGISIGEADFVIRAMTADRRIAGYLGIPKGTAIFAIRRTTYSTSGRPIDFEKLHYRGDRVSYRMRLKR